MAIKRVLNKTNKTVKEFPEFDSDKIYVSPKGLVRIQRVNTGFTLSNITHSHDAGFTIRETFAELCKDREVYTLNNQDELARFLLGCREFPKVEEIEVGEELAEDEVSVEDVGVGGIIAVHWSSDNHIHTLQQYGSSGKYVFKPFHGGQGLTGQFNTINEALVFTLKRGFNIRKFSNQEEFLRWSMEQVTGKKSEEPIQINEEALGDFILRVGKALNNNNTNGFKCFNQFIGGISCDTYCGSEGCIKATILKFKKEILGLS